MFLKGRRWGLDKWIRDYGFLQSPNLCPYLPFIPLITDSFVIYIYIYIFNIIPLLHENVSCIKVWVLSVGFTAKPSTPRKAPDT